MGCTLSVDKVEEKDVTPHVVMYGVSWCPWCHKQVAELERATTFTYNVVMCDVLSSCDSTITVTPTIVLPSGQRLKGFHGVELIASYLHS